MDPVTCPMCQGAIPGKEIHTLKTCPSCGADLSALIRQRLATLLPKAPPPQPSWFITRAAWLSLLAPCFSSVAILIGRRLLTRSPAGMLVLGSVCSLFIAGGLILGVMAFFAPKGEETGTRGKAIAGIFINGLLISFAILTIFTRQNVEASGNTPNASRKGWFYTSGRK